MRDPYWELRCPPRQQRNVEGRFLGGQRPTIVLGRKFCPGCGRWRHLCDFPHQAPDRVRPRCWACGRAQRRAYKAARTPEQRERDREYQAIWYEAKSSKRGVPRRERAAPMDKTGFRRMSAEPLRAALAQFLASVPLDDHANHTSVYAFETLASSAGVSSRLIYALRYGQREYVRLDTADHLAAAMGLPLSLIYMEDR